MKKAKLDSRRPPARRRNYPRMTAKEFNARLNAALERMEDPLYRARHNGLAKARLARWAHRQPISDAKESPPRGAADGKAAL